METTANQHPEKIVHERLQVTRDPDRQRFEMRQDGVFIGFLGYDVEELPAANGGEDETVVRLQHTIIDEAHGRKGYARALVTIVLDRLRAEGEKISPECSYVQDYLRRYPEYQDMVREV
ncbi:N-acetyltransferase [Micrococcus sp. ACRRV]|uniref:GNAT family N-acetyltransferase n=1 Tax=Micrococcus sp. ACRRV TaxID=2918203 RepID=UPI001EF38BEC|nr:GNAT family N-acetyltransferase [Micrococcus sp. ACRRV]MCG7422282.1 N-acetyltransferase [Micrococcus sp. ACRRV]